jgi:galactose mutarotase-like enzyme
MIYNIESSSLKVAIQKEGAELCSVISKKSGKEYIWQANPDIWGSHAPNLFPIIGGLKEGKYRYKDNWYEMPKHGFIRRNENLASEEISTNSITFVLHSNKVTKKIYPFDFQFRIQFSVIDTTLTVSHQVINIGQEDLLFSLGGHPAFNCPIHDNANYEDYHLEFDQEEYAETHLLDLNKGLVTDETELVLDNSAKLPLHKQLFDRDALIFKNLKSNSVSLVHKNNGKILRMNFDDFSYLGIWAKPGADYICIEPWLGIADSVDHNQNLKEKKGIISLTKNQIFSAKYSIELFE